jgi:IS4 transposase
VVTDRLDLSADVIALLYSARWKIEIYFRWLKCTLGCKQLIAESQNGVALQFYAALIASLLISLWVGRKPTRRTFEAICFYLQGWASEEDVLASVRRLKPHT